MLLTALLGCVDDAALLTQACKRSGMLGPQMSGLGSSKSHPTVTVPLMLHVHAELQLCRQMSR